MRYSRSAGTIVVGMGLVVPLLVGGCGKSADTTSAPSSSVSTMAPSTSSGTTSVAGASTPATVAASTGDGSRPTIVSFTVTPSVNAPCKDGRVQATMSWKVTPPTATVTIKDLGYGFGADTSTGQKLGPYASEVTGQPVPAWVTCNGKEYNLSLDATNGGPAFAAQTASVAAKSP